MAGRSSCGFDESCAHTGALTSVHTRVDDSNRATFMNDLGGKMLRACARTEPSRRRPEMARPSTISHDRWWVSRPAVSERLAQVKAQACERIGRVTPAPVT